MIEVIVNIVLVAAAVVISYLLGLKHGEENIIDRLCLDFGDDDFVDEDFDKDSEYEQGYKDGYAMGFKISKDISDMEFAELIAATEAIAEPKKVTKKKTTKKK